MQAPLRKKNKTKMEKEKKETDRKRKEEKEGRGRRAPLHHALYKHHLTASSQGLSC